VGNRTARVQSRERAGWTALLVRLLWASALLSCVPPAAHRAVSGNGEGGTDGAAADLPAGGDDGTEDAGGSGGSAGVGGSAGRDGAAPDGGGTGGGAGAGGSGGSARDGRAQDDRSSDTSAPRADAPDAPSLPPAPAGLTAVPGDGSVSLSWSAVSGATGYIVRRSSAAGSFTVAGSPVTTSYLDQGLTNGTTYQYVVSTRNGAGEGPGSAPLSATPAAQWAGQDVGAVTAPGSSSQSGATFTVTATAPDIWGNADAFRFVFQRVTGDATLVARVASVDNADVWTKAGLMMRDGVAAGAINVTVLTTPTTTNGNRLQARLVTDDLSTSERSDPATAPVWLRLVRRGNTITGFASTDGMSWTAVGVSKTIPTANVLSVGLAVTSHAASSATATFDSVSLTTP
jgi:regulation of enolase protein 1 (concanavalin A-like superfamily)